MGKVHTRPVVTKFGEPRGITGATMEDGTVYSATRSGTMQVDRADHIAAMKRDPRVADNIALENFVPSGLKGRVCPSCNFSAWAWQT